MRLFVGVWPSPAAVEVLAGLRRPPVPALRYTSPAQWHVTLVFLGAVPDEEVAALGERLAQAARHAAPAEARAGPAVAVLGRGVLCVPVAGLDPLAALARAAVAGPPADPAAEPFVGHLTLARIRGRRRMPAAVAGEPVDARWPVHELCLVASTPGANGSRYTTVRRVALGR